MLQYCVYCARPEGVKRPEASAVGTAILQYGRVVTRYRKINALTNSQDDSKVSRCHNDMGPPVDMRTPVPKST